MSYCRWSSDDWRCDIYCYESADGVKIHVAAMRVVPAEPFPPPIDYDSPDADRMVVRIVERMAEVSRIVRVSERVPIGLAHDGESYTCAGPAEAADKLEYLASIGYNVPLSAIADLREEAAA